MDREFIPIQWKTSEPNVNDLNDPTKNKNIRIWFEAQPAVGKEAWLLAHADDGVIWGKLQDGKLVASNDAFFHVSPPLRIERLQEAWLFGEKAEVRIWREGKEFRAIRIEDQDLEWAEAFDEDYILWGTKIENKNKGFTLVAEGRQGLRHAVPLDLSENDFGKKGFPKHPLRLRVRHYIDYDEDGRAFIRISRLVKLWVEGGLK